MLFLWRFKILFQLSLLHFKTRRKTQVMNSKAEHFAWCTHTPALLSSFFPWKVQSKFSYISLLNLKTGYMCVLEKKRTFTNIPSTNLTLKIAYIAMRRQNCKSIILFFIIWQVGCKLCNFEKFEMECFHSQENQRILILLVQRKKSKQFLLSKRFHNNVKNYTPIWRQQLTPENTWNPWLFIIVVDSTNFNFSSIDFVNL